MAGFGVSDAPADLFPEPDPTTPPIASLDGAATLAIKAQLGEWAKVEVAGPPVLTGWIPRARIAERDAPPLQRITVFPEPLAEIGAAVEARAIRRLLTIESWAKIAFETARGEARTGWIRLAPQVDPPKADPPAAAEAPPSLVLGINDIYREALLKAQETTGIDAAALASVIDAEAARIGEGADRGRWNPRSLNAGSGAAGLTQFLASTWIDQAGRSGTILRSHCQREGLVDAQGIVVAGRRDALLELRFDPTLSIVAAAEYGAANLRVLVARGLAAPDEPDDRKAWLMYLAHHEGPGGAAGFLGGSRRYSLDDLRGQVGATRAQQLAERAGGDANKAYRDWLTGYIDGKIRPARFREAPRPPASGGGARSDGGAAAEISPAKNPEEIRSYTFLEAGMRDLLTAYDGPALSVDTIGDNPRLAIAVQTALSLHGYLDPPADGEFGQVSRWALARFCKRMRLDLAEGATRRLTRHLADPENALPPVARTGEWIDSVIACMQRQGYFICRDPDGVNIVYVEGMDDRGILNADRPNEFNDVRLVFSLDEAGRPEATAWLATSEPGDFYTVQPLNPQGAARIAFNQYKSWSLGTHKAGSPGAHEALVQSKPVTVHRDFNEDHKRIGDRLERGLFGVNQHWGYDLPRTDIGKASAGCLVGRTKDGHRAFMAAVKRDGRFKASAGYRFVTTILPGDKLGL
ncbi:peptidoglycan-binding protein [Enterovirga rhinocerotis]|uniref:Peptidoglycan binding protein n=1 Tax=Enterovirga rhinocerotis TaxID=1339210 RepID=A0A4R7BZX9_9HYPH|nr:peptidoglycan-binding protein [Enterovirga rhinocerotis]TDR89777.1 hypothetical protein EV668_2612 [Enterovirga rhinocerotis]